MLIDLFSTHDAVEKKENSRSATMLSCEWRPFLSDGEFEALTSVHAS